MIDYVAARIADADEIRQSRQFPYQFLTAYLNAASEPGTGVLEALLSCTRGHVALVTQEHHVFVGTVRDHSDHGDVTGLRARSRVPRERAVQPGAAPGSGGSTLHRYRLSERRATQFVTVWAENSNTRDSSGVRFQPIN